MAPILFSIAIFVPLALIEYFFWFRRNARTYPTKEVAASVGVYSVKSLTGLFLQPAMIAFFTWVGTNYSLTTIEMNKAWHFVVLFFGVEFTYYWMHRLSHEIRWFWGDH